VAEQKPFHKSCDSSESMVTRLRAGRPVFHSGYGQGLFSLPRPDWF